MTQLSALNSTQKTVELTCVVCGKQFRVLEDEEAYSWYCSAECREKNEEQSEIEEYESP